MSSVCGGGGAGFLLLSTILAAREPGPGIYLSVPRGYHDMRLFVAWAVVGMKADIGAVGFAYEHYILYT